MRRRALPYIQIPFTWNTVYGYDLLILLHLWFPFVVRSFGKHNSRPLKFVETVPRSQGAPKRFVHFNTQMMSSLAFSRTLSPWLPVFFCRTCEWQILKCIHMHFSVHIFPHLIRLNSHLFVESSFYSSLVFRFPTIRYSHSHYAIAEWAANE